MLDVAGHHCKTAREAGLAGMTNRELLAQADHLFDVLITVDRNMYYQQNLTGRNIAILVLCARSNDISDIEPLVQNALIALESIKLAKCLKLDYPGTRIAALIFPASFRQTSPADALRGHSVSNQPPSQRS
jgi:hypothetical protein